MQCGGFDGAQRFQTGREQVGNYNVGKPGWRGDVQIKGT